MYPPLNSMTLANMRLNGAHSIIVCCTNATCRHEAIVNVDGYDAALTVPSLDPRMRCQQCSQRGADVLPNWSERQAIGALDGRRSRGAS